MNLTQITVKEDWHSVRKGLMEARKSLASLYDSGEDDIAITKSILPSFVDQLERALRAVKDLVQEVHSNSEFRQAELQSLDIFLVRLELWFQAAERGVDRVGA